MPQAPKNPINLIDTPYYLHVLCCVHRAYFCAVNDRVNSKACGHSLD